MIHTNLIKTQCKIHMSIGSLLQIQIFFRLHFDWTCPAWSDWIRASWYAPQESLEQKGIGQKCRALWRCTSWRILKTYERDLRHSSRDSSNMDRISEWWNLESLEIKISIKGKESEWKVTFQSIQYQIVDWNFEIFLKYFFRTCVKDWPRIWLKKECWLQKSKIFSSLIWQLIR